MIKSILASKNKRAVTEVISYVLLIVIAMSMAAGVYAWMRFYVPSEKEEKCADEAAISITDYTCTGYISATRGSEIKLTLSNQGLFEVDGFFITASDDIARPAYKGLNSTDPGQGVVERYNIKLGPGNSTMATFYYNKTGELTTLKRIKIQPFKAGTKALLPCPYIAEIRPEGC